MNNSSIPSKKFLEVFYVEKSRLLEVVAENDVDIQLLDTSYEKIYDVYYLSVAVTCKKDGAMYISSMRIKEAEVLKNKIRKKKIANLN